MGYIIYKSYQLTLSSLNEYVYNNMSHDISKLNWHHPIQCYTDSISSRKHIDYVYGKLGIIDYNDYIYNISPDMERLNFILKNNIRLESEVSSIVLSDIISQHSRLFTDMGEELVKRVFRLSIPLLISVALLTGVIITDNVTSILI